MTPVSSEYDDLILSLIDGRISEADASRLQDRLLVDDALRRRYVELTELEFSLHEVALNDSPVRVYPHAKETQTRRPGVLSFLIAASVLLVCGLTIHTVTQSSRWANSSGETTAEQTTSEPGFAWSVRASQVKWAKGSPTYQATDRIPAGPIAIDAGEMHLDFFSGASMYVKGPARLQVLSDWRVRLDSGVCRFRVPQVAKGFTVEVSGHEVIDLGTEFIVRVDHDVADVRVVEGAVLVRSRDGSENEMRAGETRAILTLPTETTPDSNSITKAKQNTPSSPRTESRYEQWNRSSKSFEADPRLIAYYPIARTSMMQATISNASPLARATDASVTGTTQADISRFFDQGQSLNFTAPDSGLRFRADGSFKQLTMCVWARIDELPHVYNALMLTDQFDPGEPHWLLTRTGKLHLVMMSGSQADAEALQQDDSVNLWERPWYRHYQSPVIWTPSDSGRWMHLATVYDPINREVKHFVDGECVANFDGIGPRHRVDDIRIGTAELGDWGRPYKTKYYFERRNLQGAIDEFMLFDAALSEQEIHELYRAGNPNLSASP